MPYESLDIPLAPSSLGTQRVIRMFRFGPPEARPKAYIHAGLHADETPGMLAAHHLINRLEAAEKHGAIRGQVVVVPCANPIGLDQYIHGHQSGRYELGSGVNFNRGWPLLGEIVAQRVDGRLGDDSEANTALIHDTMRTDLEARVPARELEAVRLALAREACDADTVLDLHCDDEALVHLFLMASQWPAARDLAGELNARAVLLADNAGGATFIESMYAPWAYLASRFPRSPIQRPALTATVELRGLADTNGGLAAADAAALFHVLQHRGHVGGEPREAPPAPCDATGLDACDIIRAPMAGLLDYHVAPGQEVARDAPVADIVDPTGLRAPRQTVRATADGLVLSRRAHKLAAPGDVVAKIAGTEPLTHRQGYLLED